MEFRVHTSAMGKTTRHLVLNVIEHTVDVAAPPEKVWSLVSDLPRIAEWSPQVVKTFVPGGVRRGAKMINLNRRGLLFWPTRSEVVAYEPGREVAWRVSENGATWSFTLDPTATGTRLVHRREFKQGPSELHIRVTDRFLGGQGPFQAELQQGMRQTLEHVKTLAEA